MSLFGFNRFYAESAVNELFTLRAKSFAKDTYIEYLDAKIEFNRCFYKLLEIRKNVNFLIENELYDEFETERNEWITSGIHSDIELIIYSVNKNKENVNEFYQCWVNDKNFNLNKTDKKSLEEFCTNNSIYSIPQKYMNEHFTESIEYKKIIDYPIKSEYLLEMKSQIDTIFNL